MEIEQKSVRLEKEVVAPPRPPSPETESMVKMMEQQLRRLAGIVRRKDEELLNLQATVHNECREREDLQNVILVVRSDLEKARSAMAKQKSEAEIVRPKTEEESAIMQRGLVKRSRGRGGRM